MQDLGYELPRIPIPRTRVNKGQQKRRAKVVTIAFPLPSHTDKTSSDRYQGFGRYPKLSGTYQRPCSARSAPLYGCVYKPIETVVLCVRSSGPSRARSSATRAFKAALRSFGTLGAGSAEELETLRLSRQGCVEVPLASTDPCLPLSNRTSARICLHLKSPDLIVTINLRVVLKARNFGACDHGRHGYHLRVEVGPPPRIGYEQGRGRGRRGGRRLREHASLDAEKSPRRRTVSRRRSRLGRRSWRRWLDMGLFSTNAR